MYENAVCTDLSVSEGLVRITRQFIAGAEIP